MKQIHRILRGALAASTAFVVISSFNHSARAHDSVVAEQDELSLEDFTPDEYVGEDPQRFESELTDLADLPANRALVAPLWEKKKPEARIWTNYSYEVIEKYAQDLVKGPKDVTSFCPRYNSLDSSQKISFWIYLFSAMSYYESGHDPLNRFIEKSLGKDRVTNKTVYSEGLLQLSYQDAAHYPFCKDLDWQKDRNLKPTDPKKTILDPLKNLHCGIRILNHQVMRKGRIALSKGVYWAVLRLRKKSKVYSIMSMTKQVPFCVK